MLDTNTTIESHKYYFGGHYVAVIILIFSAIGVIVNVATIIALCQFNNLRQKATTIFVINLCASDILYAIVSLPIVATEYWLASPITSDLVCRLNFAFDVGHFTRCIFSMMAITINRYFLICQPEMYSKIYTSCNNNLMIIFIWTISIVQMVPPMTGIWGKIERNSNTKIDCFFSNEIGVRLSFLLFNAIVPITVIIIAYFFIYKKVNKKNTNLNDNNEVNIQSSSDMPNENRSMMKLMILLLSSFVIIFLLYPILLNVDNSHTMRFLHLIALVIYCTHVFIDPIIFYCTDKLYRTAYRQMLRPWKN